MAQEPRHGSAASTRGGAVRALGRGGAAQAFHVAVLGGRTIDLARAGALDVAARKVVARDDAAVAGPHPAAVHVVAIEATALAADGAAGHGVVAHDVAVVAAAG